MTHCISPSWGACIASRLVALGVLVLAFDAPA